MSSELWPKDDPKEIRKECRNILSSSKNEVFLCQTDKKQVVGFVSVSLRNQYISGASKYPVGYLEGLYVKEEYRKKGVAKELVIKAENWAKKQGCLEMVSDTWDWNIDSQKFHEKLGFIKKDILVHYIKTIT